MNVICDQCHKRYVLPDERVRGKSVKVRCRQCQNIIRVDGPPEPDDERTTAVPEEQLAALKANAAPTWEDERTVAAPQFDPRHQWFAMIKGKQVGPLAGAALQAKVTSGEITERTYLWREGMADWKRALDLPELVPVFIQAPRPSGPRPQPPKAPASSPLTPPATLESAPSPAPISVASPSSAVPVRPPQAVPAARPPLSPTAPPASTKRPTMMDVALSAERPLSAADELLPHAKSPNEEGAWSQLFGEDDSPPTDKHDRIDPQRLLDETEARDGGRNERSDTPTEFEAPGTPPPGDRSAQASDLDRVPPQREEAEPSPARRAKGRRSEKQADPFAAVGGGAPSDVNPAFESTSFFIAQAGVNKRNPPWKIALFVVGFIALPVGLLYLLSALNVVPLKVVRVDDSGAEVSESVFSSGGVSGLSDLLLGRTKKKREAALAAAAERAAKGESGRKVGAAGAAKPGGEASPATRTTGTLESIPLPDGMKHEDVAAAYRDDAKRDFRPKVAAGAAESQKEPAGGNSLAADEVRKVVEQFQPAFQQCIEQELRKNPSFRGGKINIVATVGPSGVVKKAEIDRRDIDLSDLGGCLKGRARKMAFPPFGGEDEAEIQIPLILGTSM